MYFQKLKNCVALTCEYPISQFMVKTFPVCDVSSCILITIHEGMSLVCTSYNSMHEAGQFPHFYRSGKAERVVYRPLSLTTFPIQLCIENCWHATEAMPRIAPWLQQKMCSNVFRNSA